MNISKYSFQEIRLITDNGTKIEILDIKNAIEIAKKAGLDLVLVDDSNSIPVCKLLNFDKLRFESRQRKKQQKKPVNINKIKEIRFHININQHDYEYKIERMIDFLNKGFKVKIVLIFRGREIVINKENGHEFVNRLIKKVENIALPEGKSTLNGRSIALMFRSVKK